VSERKNVFIPLAIVRVDFPYSEHDLTRIIFSAYYLLQNSVRSLFMVAVIWFYGSKPALGIGKSITDSNGELRKTLICNVPFQYLPQRGPRP
jgi:hypothetical protein